MGNRWVPDPGVPCQGMGDYQPSCTGIDSYPNLQNTESVLPIGANHRTPRRDLRRVLPGGPRPGASRPVPRQQILERGREQHTTPVVQDNHLLPQSPS